MENGGNFFWGKKFGGERGLEIGQIVTFRRN
jgi:hypothetical protein